MEGVVLMFDPEFYRNRTVLVTGHTGFKGSWMCKLLSLFGAKVVGYSLEPPTVPSLFKVASVEDNITSITGDIRDLKSVSSVMMEHMPEFVIHMAAQPIVRESYIDPVYTYETNVIGTVNVLESIRRCDSVRSFVNVTTDKVYRNNEWEWGYRENDALDGHDPYSNSKSCAELVTNSYRKSFFCDKEIAISTCRAGNVIGGGDFARDRIIPDCIRATGRGEKIIIRNPYSTRPYQHVLEPVFAYLMVAQDQYENISLASSYNVGPDDEDCVNTRDLVDAFCLAWGNGASWESVKENGAPHEANFLKLDCSRIKGVFGWKPRWHILRAVEKTVEWSKAYLSGQDVNEIMKNQIEEYLSIPLEVQ